MGRIPQHTIDQVVAANDIVDVVSSYVELTKQSGQNQFGLCPFHSEKTPSFSVTPAKQIYYCFGCHKGGGVIRFIQEIEHLSFPEAVRFLADRAGIVIEEETDERWAKKRAYEEQIYNALLEAARFFHRHLVGSSGKRARDYLTSRDTSMREWRRFGLGYAPIGWENLLQALKKKGISEKILLDAGLVSRTRNDNLIDFFRDRIMFPIMDMSGRVLGFGGRALTDDGPKYINTTETPVFHKGSRLFALPGAVKSRSDTALITEGYMDVIALSRAGIDCAVAPLGTALTLNQARLIQRYFNQVNLLFDADAAGENAALKAADLFRSIGLEPGFILLPEGMDPDDYMRVKGLERLREAIDNPIDLTKFRLERLKRMSYEKETDRLRMLEYQEGAVRILSEEDNLVLRSLHAAEVGTLLGVPKERLLQEIDRRLSTGGLSPKPASAGFRPTVSRSEHVGVKQEDERVFINEITLLIALIDEPDFARITLPIKRMPDTEEDPVIADLLKGFDLSGFIRPGDFQPGVMREVAEAFIERARDEDGVELAATYMSILDRLSAECRERDNAADKVERIRRALSAQMSRRESEKQDLRMKKEGFQRLLCMVRSERLRMLRDEKIEERRAFMARNLPFEAERLKSEIAALTSGAAYLAHSTEQLL